MNLEGSNSETTGRVVRGHITGWLITAMAAAASLMTAGCNSGPVAPALGAVKGKVTLDGNPVEGLIVVFMPDLGRSSTGMTDKDGNYSLEFDQEHKGAVVGKHKVRITKRLNANLETPGAASGPPVPLPERYNDSTTLEADVKEGENTFNYELTTTP